MAALSAQGARRCTSWRTLLNDGYVNLGRSVWGVVFPAGMLAVATLGFTLLGEAVRDWTEAGR